MAVNRFVLNGISYHGKGAIQEIPGIPTRLEAMKEDGTHDKDDVDTPGTLTGDLGKYIQASDLIVVPTRMSCRDQQPLELMVKAVREAGTPAGQSADWDGEAAVPCGIQAFRIPLLTGIIS